MYSSASILNLFKFLVVFLSILLTGCTTIKHGLYDVAIGFELWRAGLEAKTLDWEGKPISYLENSADGSKETIVMVHGYAANKENWVRFAAYLTKTYHVVAIDLPGHGESVKDVNLKYGWDNQVQYIHDILSHLNINKCHMAGNSMGGGISCLYAVKYPNQLTSLLLIDSAGICRFENEFITSFKQGKNPFIIKNQEDFEKLMDLSMGKKPFIPWPIVSVMAQKAMENQTINNKILSDILHDRGVEFENEFKKIKVPTLIMWGAQDNLVSAKNADVLQEMIPNSKKFIFDGVGHVPMFQVPEMASDGYKKFLASLQHFENQFSENTQ